MCRRIITCKVIFPDHRAVQQLQVGQQNQVHLALRKDLAYLPPHLGPHFRGILWLPSGSNLLNQVGQAVRRVQSHRVHPKIIKFQLKLHSENLNSNNAHLIWSSTLGPGPPVRPARPSHPGSPGSPCSGFLPGSPGLPVGPSLPGPPGIPGIPAVPCSPMGPESPFSP